MIGVNLSGLGQSGVWGLLFHAGLIGGRGYIVSRGGVSRHVSMSGILLVGSRV